jgi:O-antigen ligase
MRESYLAKALRWLVYTSAFVPLIIFSQYISPFHFGKVIVLRSIVQVMAALYVLLIWRDASYRPKGHPVLWTFLAFAVAFTITSITSVASIQSVWGTLERMGGLFTFWHYFVFYVIAVSVLRTRRDWQVLLEIMIGVGVASALYGFLQKTDWTVILGSGGRQRPFGTIGNPALFAGYQILVAFMTLTLSFMKRTTTNMQRWYWIAGGTMLLAAISTAVRGSLIGIAVGGLTWVLLWSVLNRSKRAKSLLLMGMAGVVVFIFLAVLLRSTPLVKSSPYLTRITDFSSKTFTVQTRFWAWTAGLQGWSENPKTILVGWGPENFNVPFSKHFNPKFFTGPGAETFFDRAHNMFMEVLVTMGLLGLLTYLGLFAAAFRTCAGHGYWVHINDSCIYYSQRVHLRHFCKLPRLLHAVSVYNTRLMAGNGSCSCEGTTTTDRLDRPPDDHCGGTGAVGGDCGLFNQHQTDGSELCLHPGNCGGVAG